jgi:uncharacterized coiled-coil protein SlyX
MAEQESLIARIRQLRRVAATAEQPSRASSPDSDEARIAALESKVAHLERLVEGLQDSVHREFERHRRLIAGLQAQVDPAAMSAALSRDARERGL